MFGTGLLYVVAQLPEEAQSKSKKKKTKLIPVDLKAAFEHIDAVAKVKKLGELFGGDKERRLLEHEVLKLGVGASVKVYWPGPKRWYSGKIVGVNSEAKTFSVHYDDDRALPAYKHTRRCIRPGVHSSSSRGYG